MIIDSTDASFLLQEWPVHVNTDRINVFDNVHILLTSWIVDDSSGSLAAT